MDESWNKKSSGEVKQPYKKERRKENRKHESKKRREVRRKKGMSRDLLVYFLSSFIR